MSTIRFYYGSGSPFAWRVQLALEEKGIAYDATLLSFPAGDLKKPEYLAISPHGKVPALVEDGVALYESQAILEYLEETRPTPALLPAAPKERALVRIEELEAVTYFSEAFRVLGGLLFFTPVEKRDEKAIAQARGNVRGLLEVLEKRASRRGGLYVMGGALTRADLTWIPFVELAGRAGVDVEPAMPWLAVWRGRMRARPAYHKTYPPHWRT